MEVNKVIQGDCLEVLKSLPDKSIDLVLTDPPYGVDYQSAWRIEEERFDKIANDKTPFIWFIYDVARVLKDGGSFLCFTRWDVKGAFEMAIKCTDLAYKSEIIWDKEVHGLGDLKGEPAPQYETVLFASKPEFKFQNGRPKNVVRHQRVNPNDLAHPNEKPIGLLQKLLSKYSAEGGVVLDCFAGSGSTGIACIKTNRNYILIEKEPKYVEIINKRIKNELDQFKLAI